ncbi:hypothetical protein PFISCL1PPCAC_16935, partial [Pristionchus fissidentatus]
RYQKRAFGALTLQGVVPSITFSIPLGVEIGIYLLSQHIGHDRNLSIISATVCCLLTSHSFVHSMTILACSLSYRRTLMDFGRTTLSRAKKPFKPANIVREITVERT